MKDGGKLEYSPGPNFTKMHILKSNGVHVQWGIWAMGKEGNGALWAMRHEDNGAWGQWDVKAMGHEVVGHEGIEQEGNGVWGQWGKRTMGHEGNGVCGHWAMRHEGNGVCGQWSMWAMRHEGDETWGHMTLGYVGNGTRVKWGVSAMWREGNEANGARGHVRMVHGGNEAWEQWDMSVMEHLNSIAFCPNAHMHHYQFTSYSPLLTCPIVHNSIRPIAHIPHRFFRENYSFRGSQKSIFWYQTAVGNATCLAHPREDSTLRLYRCIHRSFGAVLVQKLPYGRKQILAYFSKALNETQKRYFIFDLELLAVFLAVKHFENLILDRSFTIVTDHLSLIHAFRKRSSSHSPHQSRQLSFLTEFNCTFEHNAGYRNPTWFNCRLLIKVSGKQHIFTGYTWHYDPRNRARTRKMHRNVTRGFSVSIAVKFYSKL